MGIWKDRPSKESKTASYRVIRTPAKGSLKGIIVSAELVGVELHYHRGRSVPCTGVDCEPCMEGREPRWKGHVFLFCPRTRNVAIFEFTERAFDEFDAHSTAHKTLYGAQMEASRLNQKPNGPLHVQIHGVQANLEALPKPTGLDDILLRMWEVNQRATLNVRGNKHDETLTHERNGRSRVSK